MMKRVLINILLISWMFTSAFGALSATHKVITKSYAREYSVKIDISFEKTHLANLFKLKFCVPRKSDLYPQIEVIGFVVADKTSQSKEPNTLLSIKTNYEMTKKGFQEYLIGEFYIAESFLDSDTYDFLLILYDKSSNETEVDLKSFYYDDVGKVRKTPKPPKE